MENWKDIIGFEGLYLVSDCGKVKSLGNGNSTNSETKKVRLLNLKIKNNGYFDVKLSKNSKRFYKSIHRLVATAFNHKPNVTTEVNHIDGDKANNHYSNLEWVTSSENKKHAYRTGLQKRLTGADNRLSLKINQLSLNGDLVKKWNGIKDCCRQTGFNSFGIIKCCKREKKYKTAYGFQWEYNV